MPPENNNKIIIKENNSKLKPLSLKIIKILL